MNFVTAFVYSSILLCETLKIFK